MSRENFSVEKAISIFKENSDTERIDLLFGAGVPGGDAGEQDDAPIGSLYLQVNGSGSTIFQKKSSANSAADWEENGSSSLQIGTFRPERVVTATDETLSAGARDLTASPFTDDEAPLLTAADFVVGNYVIGGSSSSPVLYEVTDVTAPNITLAVAANQFAQDDTFVVRSYLPDSPGDQEAQSILNYNGSIMIKIADFNFAIATGINLSGSYAAASGDVAAGDTVEEAISKIDGNNDAQDTLLGAAQGDTDLGVFPGATITTGNSVKGALSEIEAAYEETDTNVDDLITLSGMPENSQDLGSFPGAVISDGQDVKGALSELEAKDEAQDVIVTEIDGNVDDLIALSGMPENSTDLGSFNGDLLADGLNNKSALQRIEDLLEEMKSREATGVTAEASVDEVPVATYKACKWLVQASEDANPANVKAFEIYAVNDGTSADDTTYAKLRMGANFDLSLSVDVSGGNMRLRASSSSAGVTVRARRIGVMDI